MYDPEGGCSAEESLQMFTKRWVTAVNRGGLFLLKDEVYMLFLEMETKLRKHLLQLTHGMFTDRVESTKTCALQNFGARR